MAYKDKAKQREAQRNWVRQKRNKGKVRQPGSTPPLPANYGLDNCECVQCRILKASKSKYSLNHGPYKNGNELNDNELNRASLPGDSDYDGVCLDEKYNDRWVA